MPTEDVGVASQSIDGKRAVVPLERLRYRARREPVKYKIRLVTTRPTYGGLRWWFLCPLQCPDGVPAPHAGKLLPTAWGTIFWKPCRLRAHLHVMPAKRQIRRGDKDDPRGSSPSHATRVSQAKVPQHPSAMQLWSNRHSARGADLPHVPRFRALALFGRLPWARADGIVIQASENLHKYCREEVVENS